MYTLLKEIFLILEDGDRRFFQQYDLTVTRFYALYHLSDNPGQTLRHLSDRMLCDKSNVTRVIKGLERDRLVFRQPHETDGRAYRLFLTDDGRKILRGVDTEHHDYNEVRFDVIIPDGEYAELETMLLRLKGALVERLGPGEAAEDERDGQDSALT